MALTDKLTAIGVAIREKTGKSDLLTLDQMPLEIASITTGGGGGGTEPPIKAFDIYGNELKYRFYEGNWDWFINEYGDKITTRNLVDASFGFYHSKLKKIPFSINFTDTGYGNGSSCFADMMNLEETPVITGTVNSAVMMWSNCALTEITAPSSIYGFTTYSTCRAMFYYCSKLRKCPNFPDVSAVTTTTMDSCLSYNAFQDCFVLDEVVNFPVQHQTVAQKSARFDNTVAGCHRLKNFTFEVNADGTPKTAMWQKQVFNLTNSVGYGTVGTAIGDDKKVSDDATYQALKDDPDWWTTDVAYSRYNHDSAVATINSLPDCSAYLSSGGTINTIKFTGAAGSKTDGGAINTLTAEEIAVATAKGWTVTLV